MILLALFFILTYICYRETFYFNKNKKKKIKLPGSEQYDLLKDELSALYNELKEIPYEKVTITSYDNIKLTAKYYHVNDNAPLQIQFHGYKGSGRRDFCGGNKLAREAGFNTLLVDQRAHGGSESKTITFGIKERLDCKQWIDYANKRFGNIPIILAGVSMGAATILMASNLDLPQNVIGIIADSPYNSPKEIICKVCKDRKIPPKLAYPLIKAAAFIYGHFNLTKTSCNEAVKNIRIPVLIIHGEDDRFVSCYMSEKIAEANPLVRRYTFENAGHGLSYLVDTKRYENIVNEFIIECKKSYENGKEK